MKQILYSELTNVLLEKNKHIETLFKFWACFCIDEWFLDTVKRVKYQEHKIMYVVFTRYACSENVKKRLPETSIQFFQFQISLFYKVYTYIITYETFSKNKILIIHTVIVYSLLNNKWILCKIFWYPRGKSCYGVTCFVLH